jgi:hypothetical protein
MTGEWPIPGKPKPPSAARRDADALHAAGVSVEIFAFRPRTNPLNYVLAWTRLRPRLRPERYDVTHAHFAQSALLALPKRLPLVVTFRESDISNGGGAGGAGGAGEARTAGLLVRLRPFVARLVARKADAVIITSEALRPRVVTRAPVHVISDSGDEVGLAARLIEVYRSVVTN